MRVYVFGNENLDFDNSALSVAENIGDKLPNVIFVPVKPNENLPFDNGGDVIVMDVVEGLKDVTVVQDDDLDKITLSPRATTHDFDLGFQLKYLKKLGRLGRVTIVGLPMREKVNYNRIHSILRKLVAQDIHGS